MSGIRSFSNQQPIASNLTIERARQIAAKNAGSEAIVKQEDGSFSVYKINQQDASNVIKRDFSSYDANVVEFSMAKKGAPDKRIAATQPQTATAVIKAPPSNNEAARTAIVSNANLLLENVDKNPKGSKYVLGGGKVDIAGGVSNADCSHLINELYNKSGVNIPYMTAKDLGSYIRGGKGVLRAEKKAENVRPGDIITFDIPGKKGFTGHVLMATGTPQPIVRDNKIVGYNLEVIDSTSSRHGGDDDRSKRRGDTGVGKGIISFGVDAKGNINSAYWKDDLTGKKYTKNVSVGTLK